MVREELMKRLFNTLEMLTKILSQMHIITSPVRKCEIWLFIFSIISSILVSFFFFFEDQLHSGYKCNFMRKGKKEKTFIPSQGSVKINGKRRHLSEEGPKFRDLYENQPLVNFSEQLSAESFHFQIFRFQQFLCLQISPSQRASRF